MVRRVRTSLGIACAWAGMFLLVGHTWAANGDQQVAFSGRANGMGGAVVAKPQDATTGLTNPAGIAFLDLGVDAIRFDVNLSASNPQRQLNDVDSENDLFVLATGAFAFKSDFFPERMRISVGAYAINRAQMIAGNPTPAVISFVVPPGATPSRCEPRA